MDPPGWAPAVIQAFESHPWLGCLLLTDTADPGFPSFPVLRADLHLEVLGRFLPAVFVNQGELGGMRCKRGAVCGWVGGAQTSRQMLLVSY